MTNLFKRELNWKRLLYQVKNPGFSNNLITKKIMVEDSPKGRQDLPERPKRQPFNSLCSSMITIMKTWAERNPQSPGRARQALRRLLQPRKKLSRKFQFLKKLKNSKPSLKKIILKLKVHQVTKKSWSRKDKRTTR